MKLLLLCLCLCTLVYCQTAQSFSGSFSEQDPYVVGGQFTGQIYYDYPGQRIKKVYNFGRQQVIEILLYASRLRYLLCGTTCDLETYNVPMPKFFLEGNEVAQGNEAVGARTCAKYAKTNPVNGGVGRLWWDGTLACQVQFVSAGAPNGTILTFSNQAPIPAGTSYDDYNNFNCPLQTCNVQMDITLILDESGSIDAGEFSSLRQFALGIANAYNIGPNAISMGIVMFATNARTILNYSNNKQTVINALNGVIQQTGNTCIGCGLNFANDMAVNHRPGVQVVYILLTDGYNNQQVNILPGAIQVAKNDRKATIFCVGVDGYDQQQLDTIRTQLPGVNTLFTVSQFNQLNSILANLTAATCLDIPGTPCGKACQGFCGCKQTCYCPSVCDDNNKCTDDTCVPGQNGNGCQFAPRICNDLDKCTDDTCDPAIGCVYTTHACSDGNACTNDTCDSQLGCRFPTFTCNDNDPCTSDSCNPNSGCVFTPVQPCDCAGIVCPAAAPCTISECNPANAQCIVKNVTCADGNVCSDDFCNPLNGPKGGCDSKPAPPCNDSNACTHDSCDPIQGCIFTPFTVADCDDHNLCTTDSCNVTSGCVHVPIFCDDGDLCTNDACETFLGCTTTPVECPASGDCSVALCNPVNGCYLEAIPGRNLDRCGVCDGDGSTCGQQLSTNAVASISAGILALIIIAAVAVCVALGIFGGKKGYDIWMRNQDGMGGAQKSPLYDDMGRTGKSPLYEPK